MAFELPRLPYAKNALAPYLSEETLEYHHGKHHAAYVKKLNELIANTKFVNMPLEEIIKTADRGPIFNNAAQHWNHSFYWNCLTPKGAGEPGGALATAIERNFKSFKEFTKEFSEAAIEGVRQRLGVAGTTEKWFAGDREGVECRRPTGSQRAAVTRLRRVGARLLYRLP